MRIKLLDEIKKVISEYYEYADCGIFHSRNIVGDNMVTIYSNFREGVSIDICYDCGYFEIFGLDREEWKIIKDFYDSERERDMK